MRLVAVLTVAVAAAAMAAAPAQAGDGSVSGSGSAADRVEELQQELDSLTEEIDDLREPVEEFELFEECMYLIGVSERGQPRGPSGFQLRAEGNGATVQRPALALDIRGFGVPTYQFLAFPAEEPPSIECNEDVGEEDTDD